MYVSATTQLYIIHPFYNRHYKRIMTGAILRIKHVHAKIYVHKHETLKWLGDFIDMLSFIKDLICSKCTMYTSTLWTLLQNVLCFEQYGKWFTIKLALDYRWTEHTQSLDDSVTKCNSLRVQVKAGIMNLCEEFTENMSIGTYTYMIDVRSHDKRTTNAKFDYSKVTTTVF